MSEPQHEVPGLVRTLRVLRERWWVVATAAILCTGAAVAYSLTATKEYTATSKLLFRQSNLPEQVGGSSPPPDVDPEATKATNVLLVTTGEVAEAVRTRLRVGRSAEELTEQVTAESESNANVVNIAVTDPDARLAAEIANVWATEFVAYSRRVAREKVQEGQALIRQRIAALPDDAETERASLREALSRLVLLESVQTGDADLLDRASVPSSPSAPNPRRDGAIALFLGIGLGIGLAFLLNVIDRRVKAIEDFEALYGFRALTSIPQRTRDPSTQRERQAALEPFRILRNGLGFLGAGAPIRVVLVTSAVPGEGKSTAAAGLARAAALAGQNVVLVEADLRRPTFHELFQLGDDRRGLTTALVGGTPVEQLLRPVLPGLKTLRVLPAGPLPPNSAELLRSTEMSDLLRELLVEVDLVVLDAPPLLPVADAQVLLDNPHVDAGLIVARAYRTDRDDVRRARAILDRHPLRRFGLVVNGLRELDSGYDYYGMDVADTGVQRLARRG